MEDNKERWLHPALMEGVEEQLVDEGAILEMAAMFKALADPTRLRIINALLVTDMCVYDLAALMGMSQSAVSHQLAALRASRLIRQRREGKQMFYSLDDEHVGLLFRQCLVHAQEAERL